MPVKKSKYGEGSLGGSNPNLLAWTLEPNEASQQAQRSITHHVLMFTGKSEQLVYNRVTYLLAKQELLPTTGVHSEIQLSTPMPAHRPQPNMNGGPLTNMPGERLLPLTRQEDTAFVLQQAANARSPNTQTRVALMSSREGSFPYTPPMGQKRKKDKKTKDKKSKKEKKEMKISAPLNVRHVGMPDMTHLSNPLPEQTNFPVEHLATMPVEGQFSPYESIRKVRDLITRGDIWTQEVILAITGTDIIIKDGSTRDSLNVIPLSSVTNCNFLQDSGGNVLMLSSQNLSSPRPKLHFFQCAMTSAETICNEIQLAIKRHCQIQQDKRKGISNYRKQTSAEQRLGENWILGPRTQPPPTSVLPLSVQPPPPPLTTPPPPPPSQPPPPRSQTPVLPPHADGGARPQASNSPAMGDVHERPLSHSFTDPHLYSAASNRAVPTSHSQEIRDDSSMGSAGTPMQRQKKVGGLVSKASTKYISSVHAKAASGKAEVEIKRTMKASRIQRDVDIINHVFDDLDAFMKLLKEKSAAWNELEKKKKKSKRKKHDAALEALKKKAEPPTEQEFTCTYQKCKYGINVIAKLGHHLSSPSPTELMKGIFGYIQELVNLNKGPNLASSVVVPLCTKQAIDFMNRKLSAKESALWNQLGGNWFITSEQWPSVRPPPPEYEIEFSDGCIPPNLHNASDCPSNFPTLDTLPREQRPSDYSDAYDGDQPEGESTLLINPAVAAAVASKAGMVTSPILPGVVVTRRPSESNLYSQAHNSQLSLTSVGSHESADTKMAKSLFDYQASTLEELSIHRGEKVEVLDDSRAWWLVKNCFGATGYLPSNLLEVLPKKKSTSRADLHGEDLVHFHGRTVPAPPKGAPPPVPSPAVNRRPSTTSSKYSSKHSPQMPGPGRKVSQQPQNLSTLVEVSESRSSTISRPSNPPGLPPPPPFSPALPPQGRSAAHPVPPPPPPPPGLGGGVGAPPPPPPPPPVAGPTPQTSLSEMIAQHKLKTVQQGKSQKKKLHQQDRPFDITGALKNRKPLRKVSTSTSLELEGVGPSAGQNELLTRLQGRKLSVETEEPDAEYKVLPWKSMREELKLWLTDQGYGGCVDKVNCIQGSQLYQMSREELREMCGVSDGIRLFSHLQKDKSKAEIEGGVARESDFQKLMRERKSMADQPEAALVRGWGRNRVSEDGGLPLRKQKQSNSRTDGHLVERETLVDGTWGNRSRREGIRDRPPGRYGISRDHERVSREKRWEFLDERFDEEQGKRGRKVSDSYGERRRSRKYSGGYDEYEYGGRRSNRSSISVVYSDDEGYRRERTKQEKPNQRRKERHGRKKHGPTNIDDFEEDELSGFESDTESGSYSSDYSDSENSWSESRGRRGKRRLHSSASASELTNAAWALGDNGASTDERIKAQQAEIKKQLSSLAQLQKGMGLKSLPPQQQQMLQQDLQKLEQLQSRLSDKPGNQSLQMQLLGQQMLLYEHLKETQEALSRSVAPSHQAPSGSVLPNLVPSQSAQNLKLQNMMLQYQQQALAEQQRQLLLDQQRQYEVEQHHLLMAAEQQRQIQLAQLAQMQSHQPLQAGLTGMHIYNPYTTAMGYY